jgi:hypothetical protein
MTPDFVRDRAVYMEEAVPRGRLLGFDARESDEELAREPLAYDVRQQILLRPEIQRPLSIDRHIWPTHFLYHPRIRHLVAARQPPLIDADPDCAGGLWLSLEHMQRRLSEHARRAIPIAVELFAPAEITVAEFPSSLIYSEPNPSSVPAGSLLLGYDVADAGFLSGLANCGYSKEEAEALRPGWAGKINDFGLLRSQEDALAVVELSNGRVPEHAPFWVSGLYRVT